jgi:hypothetical protein
VTGIGLAIIGAATGSSAFSLADLGGAPAWLLALTGSLFALAGISSLAHALLETRRASRLKRLRAASPGEPWRWDHSWNERGTTDDTGVRAGDEFVDAIVSVVALVLVLRIVFAADVPLMLTVAALPAAAVIVARLSRAALLFLRRAKYGRGRALFQRFPFRPGTTLELHVEAPRALPQHADATATLRCIEERYVTRGDSNDTTRVATCFEVYRDTAPAPLIAASTGGRALRVRFDLPRDVPVTDLSSRPCRYWEVDVEASIDGLDYAARFLVPVY